MNFLSDKQERQLADLMETTRGDVDLLDLMETARGDIDLVEEALSNTASKEPKDLTSYIAEEIKIRAA